MTESDQVSLTPRQEAFCRHVAEGLSAARAARLAGYAPGNARQSGHDLLLKPYISLRIAELRNEMAARREGEIAGLIARLERIGEGARQCGNYGAAVRAVEVQARLRGLLGDRLPLPFAETEPPDETAAPDPAAADEPGGGRTVLPDETAAGVGRTG